MDKNCQNDNFTSNKENRVYKWFYPTLESSEQHKHKPQNMKL